jgi:hypothetical protein
MIHALREDKQTGDARSEDSVANHHGSTKHGGEQKEELGEPATFELRFEL